MSEKELLETQEKVRAFLSAVYASAGEKAILLEDTREPHALQASSNTQELDDEIL